MRASTCKPIRSDRERRIPGWTSRGAVMMLLLTASTSHNSCDAFATPKLRSRLCHSTTSVFATGGKERSLLELRNGKEEENENDNGGKKEINGSSSSSSSSNNTSGREMRNGELKPPPGSPLSMLCKETAEEDSFEIHVGRALDTLRSDYPRILNEQPDLTIYDKELEVIDPSGVKLHGLKNYKNAFRLMHAIVQVFYCPERSGLTFRMCYDKARQNIRISWNAEVVPKAIFGGVRTTLHVDGISVYEISRKTGLITQHRIERLVINDTPVQPQQGIFALLRNEHDESVPVFISFAASNVVEFQKESSQRSSSLLFSSDARDESLSSSSLSTSLHAISAGEDTDSDSHSNSASANQQHDRHPGLDWDAYERKNASRKKFGLEPLTPEEFLETEAQTQQLALQQRQRAASASAAAEMTKQDQSRPLGFLERLFGDIIPEGCESNFDCDRPQICCDFGFKKICCASGTMVGNTQLQPAYVPVPADIYPPGQEPGSGYRRRY